MLWHKKGAEPPKKFKVTPSAGKLIATLFWPSKGILLVEFTEKGHSISAASCANSMRNLKEANKETSGKNRLQVLLLHDNSPVHTGHITKAAEHCDFEEINHPCYSPDLAPSDYFLFPNLQRDLRGKLFPTMNSWSRQLIHIFRTKRKAFSKSEFPDVTSILRFWNSTLKNKL